jgi:hypothetical protein
MRRSTVLSLPLQLRFVYTSDVGLAFSPSDAILIEIFPSFQIAIAGDSDNIKCFVACVNTTLVFPGKAKAYPSGANNKTSLLGLVPSLTSNITLG